MGSNSDKFLEYCKGKVFLISWINDYGEEFSDRWIAFDGDARIVFNYLKSSDAYTEELVRFKPYSYLNETGYDVAFALNSELDVNKVAFIIGEVVNIKIGRGVAILYQLVDHIKKSIGEDNGN